MSLDRKPKNARPAVPVPKPERVEQIVGSRSILRIVRIIIVCTVLCLSHYPASLPTHKNARMHVYKPFNTDYATRGLA